MSGKDDCTLHPGSREDCGSEVSHSAIEVEALPKSATYVQDQKFPPAIRRSAPSPGILGPLKRPLYPPIT